MRFCPKQEIRMICAERRPTDCMTEESARFYLKKYFSRTGANEEMYLSQRYIDFCLTTDVPSGMAKAYCAMSGQEKFKDSEEDTHSVGRDVRFVIKVLDKMSRVVPQELSMGMLLAHLEVLEGLSVD